MKDVGSSLRDTFATALSEGNLNFDDFLTTVKDKLAQFAVDRVFDAITNAFIKAFTAGTGNTGFLGAAIKVFTSLFGGSNYKFATGGVVSSSLSHGIYTQPTFFPMSTPGYKAFATGTGLLGEAGPEAVLPLERIGGKLGVSAAISSAPVNVNVTVNNNAGSDVKAAVSDDGQGNLTIDIVRSVIANDIVRGGTKVARSIETAYPGVARGRR